MTQQVSVPDQAVAATERDGSLHELAPDLAYQRLGIVNVIYAGSRGSAARWALVDAGIPGTARLIRRVVEDRFGGTPPSAIVMTHGHFDHVGALEELAAEWRAPVYAHRLEIPFLDGTAAYPPPDPSVGGGMMASVAGLYPRGPVDVSEHLRPLPSDGSVPEMTGWRWIHTPGHTPGHVSLWRESGRTLIAGDAFITTDQESAYAVMVQKPELHGPPTYFTQDWQAAEESVRRLAALEPEVAITGHGPALRGAPLRHGLRELARDFRRLAVPESGRYVGAPASLESGRAYAAPER